ncbi:MAG: OB-fold domain-containing protein [Dehalococcoidales bacterium]|nr:OB-fold domain-containing protein [Dehalococcoidales bacterium]
MVGITSMGAYLPIYRLSREEAARMWSGRNAGGTKAVAGYDEDTVTMAVAATIDCLSRAGGSAGALTLATTTAPYREKQSAAMIAAAADLGESCRTADICNSLRSAGIALRAAIDAVKAGSVKNSVVVASDCRPAAAKGTLEQALGDGAASLMIGSENVIAEIEGSYSVNNDFTDYWRMAEDTFVRTTEGRFVDEVGYLPAMQAAITGLLEQQKLTAADIASFVYYGADARQHGLLARRMKLDKDQVQDPLYGDIGNTGTAAATLMLIAALEKARPGDRILFAVYGDGCDAFLLKVTDEIKKFQQNPVLSGKLAGTAMIDYGRYAVWKDLVPVEVSTLPDRPSLSLPNRWRERGVINSLYGKKCTSCGTPQLAQIGQNIRICVKCNAKDQFEPCKFSDKKATLFTYAIDQLMPTQNPPGVNGVIDFIGGGRLVCELTDCDMDRLSVGMTVEMTYRKMFVSKGIINYFWKAKPATD